MDKALSVVMMEGLRTGFLNEVILSAADMTGDGQNNRYTSK